MALGRIRSFRSIGFPHVAHEPVALARDRTNQPLFLAAISDRLAHRVDMAGQGGFRDDPSTPYRIDQVVLADNARAVLQQIRQQVEDLRPDRNRLGSTGELPPIRIEHVYVEGELQMSAPRRTHASKLRLPKLLVANGIPTAGPAGAV